MISDTQDHTPNAKICKPCSQPNTTSKCSTTQKHVSIIQTISSNRVQYNRHRYRHMITYKCRIACINLNIANMQLKPSFNGHKTDECNQHDALTKNTRTSACMRPPIHSRPEEEEGKKTQRPSQFIDIYRSTISFINS